MAWLDTGNHDSLLDASNYVASIQKGKGFMCHVLRRLLIGKVLLISKLLLLADGMRNTDYGKYLEEVADGL